MAIAQHLAGYTLGAADLLRRAMGKKKKAELDAQYEKFSGGHGRDGYSAAAIKTLWDILLPFSDYAFNKAHSAAYGMLSYWTAYLKANYPAEYMAALLTSVGDDKDKMAIYLAECRRMGIKVCRRTSTPPARTSPRSAPTSGSGCRRCATSAPDVVASIVASPQGQGRLHRLRRLPGQGRCGRLQQEGRRVADQGRRVRLAGPSAQGPADGARRAIDEVLGLKKAEAIGQFDLFGEMTQEEKGDTFRGRVPDTEWDTKLRLGSSGRCSGCTCPGIRWPGWSTSCRPSRTPPSRTSWTAPSRTAAMVTVGGHPDQPAAAADQEGRPVGVGHPGGSGRRGGGRVLPEGLHRVRDAAGRGRDRAGQGAGRPVGGPAVGARPVGGGAGSVERPRPGPVQLSIAANRCTPPVVDRLKDVLQATRAPPSCTSSCSTGPGSPRSSSTTGSG